MLSFLLLVESFKIILKKALVQSCTLLLNVLINIYLDVIGGVVNYYWSF
jgi:hypothetical protein